MLLAQKAIAQPMDGEPAPGGPPIRAAIWVRIQTLVHIIGIWATMKIMHGRLGSIFVWKAPGTVNETSRPRHERGLLLCLPDQFLQSLFDIAF
jgi:hypothetical protein